LISNAPLASMFVIFAKTDPVAGHRGISVLRQPDTPSLSVGKPLGSSVSVRTSGGSVPERC
jgi:acyl-CoA dehydrogenase